MSKYLLLPVVFLMVALLAGCALVHITGSGNVVTQEEPLSGFDRVEISHAFHVDIRQGESYRVVVRVDDNLYVRSYRGRNGAWYRSARVHHKGRIWAGDVEKDVTFVEESDPNINDQIDAVYHSKYRPYPQFVAPMVTAEVRSTTLKLVPRGTGPLSR